MINVIIINIALVALDKAFDRSCVEQHQSSWKLVHVGDGRTDVSLCCGINQMFAINVFILPNL